MKDSLDNLGINVQGTILRNLTPDELTKEALGSEDAKLNNTGALLVKTGKYTGRAPKNRFFVSGDEYHDEICWCDNNLPIEKEKFDKLYDRITAHFSEIDKLYVFDGMAGANEKYGMNIRVINELASQNLCARNMFIRLKDDKLENFKPDFTVIAAPSLKVGPEDGVEEGEAAICINLTKKVVIILGSGYAGEIKKSIFTIMNFMLPRQGVLPMHCAANAGLDGDTALFFGLSGTGKTTLSSDENRKLIGDDEHGWCEDGIFNFEGGCYAKTINLKKEFEPQIYNAIRSGSVVENVIMNDDGVFDYTDTSITQNGRVSYPLEFIDNAELSGRGKHPKTILFLTADSFGVFPPVAKLDYERAMYHFISGYTCKLAGTETGIVEPKVTFSCFFGAPFMPQKPMVYANLLAEYMKKYDTQVFLVNTGWTGGPYGTGHRISINDTRAIVTAALDGELNDVGYINHPIFNLLIPKECPMVDSTILDPINTWEDKEAYNEKAKELAIDFVENFKQFESIPQNIVEAGPKW